MLPTIYRQIRAKFCSLNELNALRTQIQQSRNQMFKTLGLMDQVHSLSFNNTMLVDYVQMLKEMEIETFIKNKKFMLQVHQKLNEALEQNQEDQEIQHDAINLKGRLYQIDEVNILKNKLKNLFEQTNEEDQNVRLSSIGNLVENWEYFEPELNNNLQEYSILNRLKKGRGIQIFQNFDFHQTLYYMYLIKTNTALNPQYHEMLLKSFSSASQKDIDSFDLIILVRILSEWIYTRGYTKETEQILRKFDHYLEKCKNLTNSERIAMLECLERIDIPQKFPVLISPLLNDFKDNKIQKEEIPIVINYLLNFVNVQDIEQLVINRLDDIKTLRDCILVMQGFVWHQNYSPLVFDNLLKKSLKYYEEFVNDQYLQFADRKFKMSSCTFHQIFYSLNVDKQTLHHKYRFPFTDIEKIYFNRGDFENRLDFSKTEEEVDKIVRSLPNIEKIERHFRVAIFQVDFKIKLNDERVVLIDVIGGSQFVGKNGQSHRLAWRNRLIQKEYPVKSLNISQWNDMNHQKREELIQSYFIQKV